MDNKNAWNADEGIGNLILFRFQRHSDHHLNPYKVYATMDLTDDMPKWPIGKIDIKFRFFRCISTVILSRFMV